MEKLFKISVNKLFDQEKFEKQICNVIDLCVKSKRINSAQVEIRLGRVGTDFENNKWTLILKEYV